MKIEKVNDHQIRCTLTREDLASRKLKISELAYGTQKAKALFRDMMEMANYEYGFEADNIPLMIEAIPMNSECIVLIITKVEDPEELDTRFSKFAPGVHDNEDEDASDEDFEITSENDETGLSELFSKFKEAVEQKTEAEADKQIRFDGMAFSFDSIKSVASVAKKLNSFYSDESKLYRNNDSGEYLLILKRDRMDMIDFVKACNLASEFGGPMKGSHLGEAYLEEHYEVICPKEALSIVSFL